MALPLIRPLEVREVFKGSDDAPVSNSFLLAETHLNVALSSLSGAQTFLDFCFLQVRTFCLELR